MRSNMKILESRNSISNPYLQRINNIIWSPSRSCARARIQRENKSVRNSPSWRRADGRRYRSPSLTFAYTRTAGYEIIKIVSEPVMRCVYRPAEKANYVVLLASAFPLQLTLRNSKMENNTNYETLTRTPSARLALPLEPLNAGRKSVFEPSEGGSKGKYVPLTDEPSSAILTSWGLTA